MLQIEINRDQQQEATPTGAHNERLAVLASRGGDYVMTISEVARVLTVCTKTVRRAIDARKIHAIRVSERRRGILASEVARFLSQSSS